MSSSNQTTPFSEQTYLYGQNATEATGIVSKEYLTAEEYIILIGTPIIYLLGTTGNIFSAIVMQKEHFRNLSTGAYLFCLAIADTVFLSVNSMTKNFINILTGIDLTKISWWSCKCYVYLLMTSKCLSAWFIVCVTTERLLVVCLPHKAKILATRRRAWIAVSLTTVVILGTFAIVPITYGLVPKPWGVDCTMNPEYDERGFRILLNTVDLVIYSILPAVILFISNIVLITKVIQSQKWRQNESSASTRTSRISRSDDITRLTVMLISVSIMFLICTSPIALLFLVKSIDDTIKTEPGYYELYRSLYLLQLSNSAINFYLYCLSGPAFKKELISLFPCADSKGNIYQLPLSSARNGEPAKVSTVSGLLETRGNREEA